MLLASLLPVTFPSVFLVAAFPKSLQTGPFGHGFPGLGKVKVTGKNKKGKKLSKTLKCAVTVKNPAVTLSQSEMTTAVGESVKLTAKTTPSSAGSSITFTTSDEKVATVANDGTVKAVAAGEATITAAAKCGTKTLTATAKITVKKIALQSVKQTKFDAIEAVIAGDTKSVKNADIVITNTDTKATIAVKELSVDEADAKKVTITTFAPMNDGKKYTVILDGVTKEFTATDNVVANVAVTPLEIVSGNDGETVYGQTVDKNGVVLSESTVTGNKDNVTFNVTTTEGYVSGDKLVLPKTGNKAVAEITYHTYKYENGTEAGAISKKFDIVAVDAKPVTISGFAYTIDASAPKDWNTLTAKTQIAVKDNTKKAYFHFIDSRKADVTAQYTVESSDDTTLLLGAEAITAGVTVTGLKEGSAYINVKKDGKFVTSLPVSVVGERKLNKVELGNTSLTVSKDAAGFETVETSVKTIDQYGSELTDGITVAPSYTGSATGAPDVEYRSADKKLVFNAATAGAGTYQFKVEVSGPANSKQVAGVSVTVVTTTLTADNATDLRLIVDNNIDLAVGDAADDTAAAKKATIKVGAYEKGALVGYKELQEIKFNGKTDNVITGSAISATTGAAIQATKAEVELNSKSAIAGSSAWLANYGAGTYSVYVKTTDNKIFNGSITLKDSTDSAVITKRKDSKVTGAAGSNAVSAAQNAIVNCLEISYKGTSVVLSGKVFVKAADVTLTGKSVYVKTAYIKVQNGKGVDLLVPVEVNQTFTFATATAS